MICALCQERPATSRGLCPACYLSFDASGSFDSDGYSKGDTVEVVFKNPPSVTAGVLKYFIIYTDGNFDARFQLYRDNHGGYGGGERYLSSTGLANVVTTFGDLSFEVMVCN